MAIDTKAFTLTAEQLAQLAALRDEDGELEREIEVAQTRRRAIKEILEAAAKLGTLTQAERTVAPKEESPKPKADLTAAIERIATEAGPITKKDLRRRLEAEGFGERLGAYFYIAINRLKERDRIQVLDDGRVQGPF